MPPRARGEFNLSVFSPVFALLMVMLKMRHRLFLLAPFFGFISPFRE